MFRIATFRWIACLLASLASASAQTFTNPRIIPTALDPLQLASTDFNKDGNLDLAYVDGNYNGMALHILLGDGRGDFTHAQDLSLPTNICPDGCYLNVADVNGDGIPDIVLGGSVYLPVATPNAQNGALAVMLGNGNGTFAPPIVSTLVLPGGSSTNLTEKMGIGDVNGDGALDIVVSNPGSNYLYVLLGDKTGHFTYSGELLDYNPPSGIVLADLNGDGALDVLGWSPVGGLFSVYFGKGNGTFGSGTNYNVGAGPSFVFTDLNGDGIHDMVCTIFTSNSPNPAIEYLAGKADGTFAAPVTVVASVNGDLIDVADYNGDGIPDLVIENPTGVGVLLGKGNLTYGTSTVSVSGSPTANQLPGTYASGNFITGGHRDLAMAAEGGIVLLEGSGNGSFPSAASYDLDEQTGATAVADFAAGGNADIAVTLSAVNPRLLLGNGNGSFTLGADPNSSYGSQTPDKTLFTGDFNGDGNPDLATIASGVPSVFFGNGSGSFSAPAQVPNGSLALADVNNDHHTDMVSVSASVITVDLGQGNDSFLAVTTSLPRPIQANLSAIGDINGDGNADLVLSAEDGFEIWLGKGDGTFAYSNTISSTAVGGLAAGVYGAAAIADIDGDGKADLILAPGSGNVPQTLAIFYGNGDGTFQAPVQRPLSHAYLHLSVADVDKDGKPDIVMSDANGISVITNFGNRIYGPEVHYAAGFIVGPPNVVDVNHDGYPDIVAANTGGTTVAVLLNLAGAATSAPAILPGTVSMSPEPSAYEKPFTIALTLQPPATGAALTGTVTFLVDGVYAGTATISGDTASFSDTATLPPGPYSIAAAYNGDTNYSAATYFAWHSVNQPVYTTKTAMTATPTAALTSQTIHLQATVTSNGPVPLGYVTFLDGTSSLGATLMNESGVAILDTALLTAGTHALSSSYPGTEVTIDTLPETFSPSKSSPVSVTITDVATTTSLSASSASPTAGTVVTFTATVSSASGTPFGNITFSDGNTQLGSLSLTGGQAAFSTASLATGSNAVTATFNANSIFGTSVSAPSTVTVQAASPALVPTLTAMTETQEAGNPRLTATVTSFTGIPAGNVTFLADGAILGSAALDGSGHASFVQSLGPGTNSITASFNGNHRYAPSSSPPLRESGNSTGPNFSIAPQSSALTVPPDGSANVRIALTSFGGFNQPVSLTCAAGLPADYSCSFAPQTMTGSGTVLLTISSNSSRLENSSGGRTGPAGLVLAFACAGIVPFFTRRRARWLLLLPIAVALGPAGCGTRPASYTSKIHSAGVLTVQAQASQAGGAIVHSSQITVTYGR